MAFFRAARSVGPVLSRQLRPRQATQMTSSAQAVLLQNAPLITGPRLTGFLWAGGSRALAAHTVCEMDEDPIPQAAPFYEFPASPKDYRFFCGHREGDDKELSNWWDESVNSNGGHWTRSGHFVWCSELGFMLEKALLFNALDTAQRLLEIKAHPDAKICKARAGEIKSLGRTGIPNFDAKTWDAASFKAMSQEVFAKFDQNEDLSKKLVASGDAYIVEAAHYDNIWGIGLRAFASGDEAGALTRDEHGELMWSVPPSRWPADGNKLGRALMLVRDMLKEKVFMESFLFAF